MTLDFFDQFGSRDITLYGFKMASAAILKIGLQQHFPATFERTGAINQNQSTKKLLFRKNGHGS